MHDKRKCTLSVFRPCSPLCIHGPACLASLDGPELFIGKVSILLSGQTAAVPRAACPNEVPPADEDAPMDQWTSG